MRKLKSIFLLLLVFILCSGFRTTDALVFDEGDLLSDDEEISLANEAQNVSDELQMQVAILTTQDAGGQSTQEYVDHFGYEQGFGYTDNDADYIVFCIDMDNREIYISTSGRAISLLIDDEVNEILSDCKPYVSDEAYFETCNQFLSEIASYVNNDDYDDTVTGYFDAASGKYIATRVEKSFKEKLFEPGNILIALIIGLVAGAVVVLIMFFGSRSKMTADGATYQKGGVHTTHKGDHFTHETVTKHKIEKDNNSGGGGGSSFHSDDSGSHGGGGMSF